MLPLPTLLSQALVAFTIEFDNEFERQMPHRTSNHGGSHQDPWLVSLAMWSNCIQFIGEEGVPVSKLADLARTPTNLNGMVRWGYIVVEPDPAAKRPKPPHSQWLIRATAKGRMAQEVWRRLFGTIEKRWEERFGTDQIGKLRKSLGDLVSWIDVDLPDCLPILGYGLFSRGPDRERTSAGRDLPLSALLSRVLLAFAMEFERESDLSLAICANVVRVLDGNGARVRDLPLLSGVSKESIAVALGFLRKKGFVVVESGSVKIARLTPKGLEAQNAYRRLLGIVEERWQAHFSKDSIRTLRELLEGMVGEPLFRGLEPYADGWRASVRKPDTLPHYPMVLHRGGFPDGS
jgi:DNA-binding MarR family transcriptional regulator